VLNTAGSPPSLVEIITGRPRPRHLRFAANIAELVPGAVLERRDRSRLQRLRTNALGLLSGLRQASFADLDVPVILHQALARASVPYAAEYDVPLAIHGYNYERYLKHVDKARRLFEQDSLRMLFVFSEWAKRSFALHFGEAAAAKCALSYPLASQYADSARETRKYDFTFIARGFRIKAGPELLRAFRTIRRSGAADAKMCVVTNLEEASRRLGDLAAFEGVEWHDASLDEKAIATILNDTHCLIHPTLWESFGVVLLEALASGCAIITSNFASMPEMLSNDNGILLDVPVALVVGDLSIPQFNNAAHYAQLLDRLNLGGFQDEITAAMLKMATDSAYRAQCRNKSRELYRRQFSPEAWKAAMRANLRAAFPRLVTN